MSTTPSTDFNPTSFDKIPIGKDDRFFVRRLNPDTVTFDEIIQFSEIILDSFGSDLMFQYWFGPNYKYDEFVDDVRQKVQDPKLRLKNYIERAKALERLTYSFARNLHLRVLARLDDYYGMYTIHPDSGYETLVGMFVWRYPSSLTKKMYDEPMSLSARFNHDYTKIKYRITDWFAFLGTGPHPMNNPRSDAFDVAIAEETQHIPNTDEQGDRLSRLSFDELVKTPYRNRDYIYLSFFVISREFQRQGLGTLLFDYCLKVLPTDAKVQFVSKDGQTKSEGPVKEYIFASPAGKALYTKFGFRQITPDFYYEPDGKKEYATVTYRLDRD